MFSSVGGSGFTSFFPRTVIFCFTCFATARSKALGGLTLQPMTESAKQSETSFKYPVMCFSWLFVPTRPQWSFHVAVPGATEVVANGCERAGGLRGDRYFLCFPRDQVGVKLQGLGKEPMLHVLRGQP